MVYFCADDYGMADSANSRIETCLRNGILNKISILPNGNIADFKKRLADENVTLSLHLNLVEGRPLSNPDDVKMLLTDEGYFKDSFLGLFFRSFGSERKELKKQLYIEMRSQIRFWKSQMGEDAKVSIDSHQHTHMIPLVFKTLMRVIKDEGVKVKSIRIPAEPLLPYILTPSQYLSYTGKGLVKQWVLKVLSVFCMKELKKTNIPSAYFMGILFSGHLNETRIQKLLPHYLKLAKKNKRDIEIGLHPGYIKKEEKLMEGSRRGFQKFYFAPERETEYHTLLNFEF